MQVSCAICSDLVTPTETLFVTKCGHIFHHVCLTQWLERSKTCPECRQTVTPRCMFRVFPNLSHDNNTKLDSATLQSKLDDAQLQIREGLRNCKQKDELIEKMAEQLEKNQKLLENYEKKAIKHECSIAALKDQLQYLKSKEGLLTECQEQNEALKKEIALLTNVQKVLSGTREEAQAILDGQQDARTQATVAAALKRALYDSEKRRKALRDELQATENLLHAERRTTKAQQLVIQCYREREKSDKAEGQRPEEEEHHREAEETRERPPQSNSPYLALKRGFPPCSYTFTGGHLDESKENRTSIFRTKKPKPDGLPAGPSRHRLRRLPRPLQQ